ncbi:MAG: alpha/beta fold hydrolase [Ktedonobacteraceae bacterium]
MTQQPNIPFMIGPEDAERACLLIHGFSGTPTEMRGLGDALVAQGMRVYGVLVAGHSGDPEELIISDRTSWITSVEVGLEQLAHYKTVFVAGLSMGGVLALTLAIHHPERIAGVVAMSTPTRFESNIQTRLVPLARYFIKWFYPLKALNFNSPKVQVEILKQAQLRDPSVAAIDFTDIQVVDHIKNTVRIPVPAIAELIAMTNRTRRSLGKLRVPLLIIQSKRDQTVEPKCAEELYRLATSTPSKSLHWLEMSDHVITTGPERDEVYRLVSSFIDTISSHASKTAPPDDVQKGAVDENLPGH